MVKSNLFVLLGMIAMAAILASRPWETNVAAQEKKAISSVTVWEYKTVKEGDVCDQSGPSVEKLNKLGEEGWELAAPYTRAVEYNRPGGPPIVYRTDFLFKRPKSK